MDEIVIYVLISVNGSFKYINTLVFVQQIQKWIIKVQSAILQFYISSYNRSLNKTIFNRYLRTVYFSVSPISKNKTTIKKKTIWEKTNKINITDCIVQY